MHIMSIQMSCGGSRVNVMRAQTGLRFSVKRKAEVLSSLDEVDCEPYIGLFFELGYD